MQKYILENCNCTDPNSFYLDSITTCETIDQQNCMSNQYTFIFERNYITSTCVPLCPLECKRTIIRTSSWSSVSLSSELYYDFIQTKPNLKSHFVNTPLTIETALNSFTAMTFYYRSNSYTISTESPSMDIVSLLANIGGTLGLFLGISLIQIFEIVDVIIQTIFVKISCKNNKIEKSSNEPK